MAAHAARLGPPGKGGQSTPGATCASAARHPVRAAAPRPSAGNAAVPGGRAGLQGRAERMLGTRPVAPSRACRQCLHPACAVRAGRHHTHLAAPFPSCPLQEEGEPALLPVVSDLGPSANPPLPAADQPDSFEHISHAGEGLCTSGSGLLLSVSWWLLRERMPVVNRMPWAGGDTPAASPSLAALVPMCAGAPPPFCSPRLRRRSKPKKRGRGGGSAGRQPAAAQAALGGAQGQAVLRRGTGGE